VNNQLVFSQDLLLAELSSNVHPEIERYNAIEQIDLSLVNNIDSAGVAYLVQIKIQYPKLLLLNASKKLTVLAELYGVEYLFSK